MSSCVRRWVSIIITEIQMENVAVGRLFCTSLLFLLSLLADFVFCFFSL